MEPEITQPCPRCGGITRTDRAHCPSCGATRIRIRPDSLQGPVPNPSKPPPSTGEALRIDIRARVMWGEKADQVRAEFLEKGAQPAEVDKAIQQAFDARRAHFRKKGLRSLVFGLLGLGAGVSWILFAILVVDESGAPVFTFSLLPLLFTAALLSAGVVLTVFGASRVLRAGKDEGAGSDLVSDRH